MKPSNKGKETLNMVWHKIKVYSKVNIYNLGKVLCCPHSILVTKFNYRYNIDLSAPLLSQILNV